MGQYVCTCVDSSKYPVQCPSPGCKATLAHHDVIWLLHDMPAHMERYTRLEVESSIHPSQRLYCPHKDCSTLLLRPEEGEPEGPMVCPACERTLCASCLIPGWHEGFSCEAFQALPPHQRSADDAALLRLSDVLRWKQCPSCSHVVERSEGCNHMACLCGGSFCYSCGLAYCDNASTAANQHGTPACACALFDVPPADQDEDDGGEDEGEDESESDEEQDAAAAPIVVAPVYGYLDRDARLCRNGRRVAKARCRHARSIHDCPHGPGTCWFRHDEDDRRLLGFWW
ncbi:hypothetical protein FOA52_001447 [Chlamydomonas sp. UWO 241]|nr:hypothetical protein FOA52_001447 [Chlamydomonas sp. UWO 241]